MRAERRARRVERRDALKACFISVRNIILVNNDNDVIFFVHLVTLDVRTRTVDTLHLPDRRLAN